MKKLLTLKIVSLNNMRNLMKNKVSYRKLYVVTLFKNYFKCLVNRLKSKMRFLNTSEI